MTAVKKKGAFAIQWRKAPEKHNYPAAVSYLSLVMAPAKAKKLASALKKAKPAQFKAKDIFRASQLSLLGVSNSHVQKDLRKIEAGTALSPILLVRDRRNSRVVIADGYHRLCAVYRFDEDAWIPCRIA